MYVCRHVCRHARTHACMHVCSYDRRYEPATVSAHTPVCTVRAVPAWGTQSTHTGETVGTTVYHCVCVCAYVWARVCVCARSWVYTCVGE